MTTIAPLAIESAPGNRKTVTISFLAERTL